MNAFRTAAISLALGLLVLCALRWNFTVILNSDATEVKAERNSIHQALQHAVPYEECRQRLDPSFDPGAETYPHMPFAKSSNLSLHDALVANGTTVYFLHQRKAGGTTIRSMLYNRLVGIYGKRRANEMAYIACLGGTKCTQFEMPLFEKNYMGSVKVVAAHMSYHTPLARSPYEFDPVHGDEPSNDQRQQVLITNFREPISRIRSCMLFRYPGDVKRVFGSANYTHESGADLLFNKHDPYHSTCVQEPLRILSPLHPDGEPLSTHDMHKICCMVRTWFHVIQTPPPPVLLLRPGVMGDNSTTSNATANATSTDDVRLLTRIEHDIMHEMQNGHARNVNKRTFANREMVSNLDSFLNEYIKDHPMIRAETDLYQCVVAPQSVQM